MRTCVSLDISSGSVSTIQVDDAPEVTLDAKIAALDAEFERKKSALAARLQTIELADGIVAASKKAAIQDEYSSLCVGHDAQVDEILFGG